MHDALKKLDMREADFDCGHAPPDKPKAMLAKLCHDPFFEDGWIYERKFDGERCLTVVKDGRVHLVSRNGKSLNAPYPELVEALETRDLPDAVFDGEIVAFDGDVTSFSRLQARMQVTDEEEARSSQVAVYYYLFDLPFFDGVDLSGYPLLDRKSVLKASMEFGHRIHYTSHRRNNGQDYYRDAEEKGWEGIIAKKEDSEYVHSRSSNWLKFKCGKGQEFVIGGFTEPEGEWVGFGALLIGYYEEDDLVYAGKVGTGYDDDFLESFRKRMDSLERNTSPFDKGEVPAGGDIHFIRPEPVGEIGFTEWTDDGMLRHPRFKGLRRDKDAKDVVREDA